MLEVRDLRKIYKEKKGADVHALDGVSLKFPEKGMVFLLGKSGSGKSTLLNVCGGLDSPTGGEIIVKGRSSSSFSGSDFDSYRNTYIGFIFQEYNILNEFSVEDNIALALELQGKSKKKSKKEIRRLLADVDLEGYAKRKPNTLSGGQKQRIAIARALIKSPEIIMADEPTGALDSNTGRQVLDTLKKLSRDKLVIVVSHDREFAETYGDRIIELCDGRVISDVSKTAIEQSAVSESINEVDSILCIKKGAHLSEGDFEKIKEFLKDADSDILIAKNEADVKSFKKVSRITDEGKEVFSSTDEGLLGQKEYTAADSRFIRSKLPLRHAIKIGVSGMKRKPIRLFFTVLLCTVAFTLFGVLSTLNFYNSESTFKETLPSSGVSLITLQKQYKSHETYYEKGNELSSYEYVSPTTLSEADIAAFNKANGTSAFGGAAAGWDMEVGTLSSCYWSGGRISAVAYLPEGHPLRANIKGKSGEAVYPQSDEQIAISSYIAELLVECGFYGSDGRLIDCQSTDELIGKRVLIRNNEYEIIGIFDGGQIPERFDKLKAVTDSSEALSDCQAFSSYLSDGLYLIVFSTEELVAETGKSNAWGYYKEDFRLLSSGLYSSNSSTAVFPEYSNAVYKAVSNANILDDCIWLGDAKATLSDGEVILPDTFVFEYLSQNLDSCLLGRDDIDTQNDDRVARLRQVLFMLSVGGTFDEAGDPVPFTGGEEAALRTEALTLVKELGIDLFYSFKLYDLYENTYASGERYEGFKVVGVYPSAVNNFESMAVFCDSQAEAIWNEHKKSIVFYHETTTDYKPFDNSIYSSMYLPYDGSRELTELCWSIYQNKEFDENSSLIKVSGSFIFTLQMVDELVEVLSAVFMWMGIILAVFAALLFSNFISVSISNKKREIGILRAVGARGFDVFKIFFSESALISIICIILSTVGSIAICSFINAEMSAGLGISLFVFGPLSFLVLLSIACLTALAATFLPVFNAARKKPVDSIRSI